MIRLIAIGLALLVAFAGGYAVSKYNERKWRQLQEWKREQRRRR